MCRWIAYRGDPTPLEHYVTAPAHSLVEQSIRALESTAATNGDGFGLGWYGEHTEPGLSREARPAWSDENLRYLCRHIRSHLFFGHVRAATATPTTRPNCRPIVCGRGLLMPTCEARRGAGAPQGRGADPGRALSLAHRHHGFGSGVSRHPGRRRRARPDRRDAAHARHDGREWGGTQRAE